MAEQTDPPATYNSSLKIHQAVSAWFLGPQAENADLLKELFDKVVQDHVAARTSYHPQDGVFITNDIKQSQVYQQMVDQLRKKLSDLSSLLNDFSVPFYSPRYAAHMTFESSLPSIVGWLSAMLLNPNNVSFEAGPITTALELEVGQDLCKMIGFENTENIRGWGHLTCDGTVANIEAIWYVSDALYRSAETQATMYRAARNLKFYPLALKAAMAPNAPLNFISNRFKVLKCAPGAPQELFSDLDTWDLLNLRPEDVLEIPDRLAREFGISSRFLDSTMEKYIVQSAGMNALYENWGVKDSPKFLIASTKHYSWPKGVALAGIGSDNLVNIPVDKYARLDLTALRHALDHCLSEHQAVYAVVATIGTTEEGAVDPIAKIIELREEYQKKGLTFLIHADAAWGGYFTSTLRDPPADWTSEWPSASSLSTEDAKTFDRGYVPTVSLKPYTIHQLEALKGADSVTIDPHKSGYCPYPAGGLCYRDRRLRHLLTWSAPYIEHGKRGEDIGIHGVEGSKPGAAAASVYMHHSIIGLHNQGHGGLLGEVSFTCARMAAHWATMSDHTTPYTVVPFNPLRFEEHELEHSHPPHSVVDANAPAAAPFSLVVDSEKEFIRTRILGRSNEDIVKDPDPAVMAELRSLGSDLNINAFVCNFRFRSRSKGKKKEDSNVSLKEGITGEAKQRSGAADPDAHIDETGKEEEGEGDGGDEDEEWVVNDDVAEANYLNRCIFDRLSVTDLGQNPRTTPMFLSSTILKHEEYGECLKHFKQRAGLEPESNQDLFVLRNVVMSPFQASADFVANIADTFRNVLEDSLKHVVHRNTITPQIHHFTVQGTDETLYLAYRPLFHKANGRQQLILEVEVPDKAEWAEYVKLRKEHPNSVFTLSTNPALPVTIDDLLSPASRTSCLVTANEFFSNEYIELNLSISNARIVKNRSLSSRWLDTDYDSKYTPFYLYGTPDQLHVDHMLLKAPNAQFTAENVQLHLDHEIPAKKLANGVLLFILNLPERAMQPFTGDESTPCPLFYPNAKFDVMICDDPFPATAHGPGLAAASDHYPIIARGSMQLPLNVYTDLVNLNREDFRDDERTTQRMDKRMNWEDQSAWRAMVMKRLGRPHSEYYSSMKGLREDGTIGDGHDISKKPDKEQERRAEKDVWDAGYDVRAGLN